ncbi:MAG: TIGR02646 family protein [Bacteroidales bacterium]|nr:TIGR02646 family protein [Bacteroidales bacterium]
MKKINKNTPPFLSKFIKKNKPKDWKELTPETKTELGEYILKEQRNQCAYCECYIKQYKSNFHIDHFKTRNLFPQLTFDYNNLFLSCTSKDNCASYKDKSHLQKKDFDKLIHPAFDNPEDSFSYLASGAIYPKNPNDVKAIFTIEKFNLQSKKLVHRRRTIAIKLSNNHYKSIDSEIIIKEFKEYESFIKYIKTIINRQ